MESLTKHITESLRIGINDKPEMLQPKTWSELRKIILHRYKKQGPGTKNDPIDFNDIDVSKMTSFCDEHNTVGIFEGRKFEYIDVSEWDVSFVKDMRYMFSDCYTLKSIGDISNWDVSRVEYAKMMFFACENLKSVGDLSNWDVSNIEDVDDVFINSAITNIPDWYKNR